jgi:hypothetical protein
MSKSKKSKHILSRNSKHIKRKKIGKYGFSFLNLSGLALVGILVLVAVSIAGFTMAYYNALPWQKDDLASASTVAPGCTQRFPTALGGRIEGWPDGRAVNALVGIGLHDAKKKDVTFEGAEIPRGSAYGYYDDVNPTISSEGQSTGDFTWGERGSQKVLCLAANVRIAYLEVYPRKFIRYDINKEGKQVPITGTDKVRYGSTAHWTQYLEVGKTNNVHVRLPMVKEKGGNASSYINGYMKYNGKAVPIATTEKPDGIYQMRAFPTGLGPECGVEGFSASADELAPSSNPKLGTYYNIGHLAGGRCGAKDQEYDLYAFCRNSCGPGVRVIRKTVKVPTNQGIRVDLDMAQAKPQ